MRAGGLDDLRRGIKQRQSAHDGFGRSIDRREAPSEAIIDVKAVAVLIQGKSSSAGSELNSRVQAGTVAASIDDDEIVRAHPGDVSTRTIGGPNDGARVAHRLFALGLAYLRSFISQVRIKIDDVCGQAERIDLSQFHADKSAIENRL